MCSKSAIFVEGNTKNGERSGLRNTLHDRKNRHSSYTKNIGFAFTWIAGVHTVTAGPLHKLFNLCFRSIRRTQVILYFKNHLRK